MQTTVGNQRSVIGGTLNSTNFSIIATPLAFETLLGKIYSDRVSAVVREIGTNAYEAHQLVNKHNEPFDIHVPTRSELYFSVRDYGPGLDDNEIVNIYTQLFNSTKTNTNTLGGCFGLGSKSPFGYTDNFTVQSWKNGQCNTYSMYRNNEGWPVCALVNSSPSTEPSGIEVRVPVKINDISLFRQSIISIYSYFNTIPKCVNEQLDIRYPETSYSGNTCNIIKTGYKSNLSVKMGNIVYPVNTNLMFGNFPEIKGMLVNVDIGDVSPEPGRESLTYDDITKTNLKKYINRAVDEFKSFVSNQINQVESVFDLFDRFHNLRNICNFAGLFHDVITKKFGFNPFSDNIITYIQTSLKNSSTTCADITNYAKDNVNLYIDGKKVSSSKSCFSTMIYHHYYCLRHYNFVIIDTPKKHSAKLKSLKYNHTIGVRPDSNGNIDWAKLQLLVPVPRNRWVKSSTISEPVNTDKKPVREKQYAKLYNSSWINTQEIEAGATVVPLIVDGHYADAKLLNVVRLLLDDKSDVYALNKRDYANAINNGHVNFIAHTRQTIIDKLNNNLGVQYFLNGTGRFYSSYLSEVVTRSHLFKNRFQEITNDRFKQLVIAYEQYIKLTKNENITDFMESVYKLYGIPIATSEKLVLKEIQFFEKEYPLIKDVNISFIAKSSDKIISDIINYLNKG